VHAFSTSDCWRQWSFAINVVALLVVLLILKKAVRAVHARYRAKGFIAMSDKFGFNTTSDEVLKEFNLEGKTFLVTGKFFCLHLALTFN
jgi:hypothetical protein